MMIEDKEAVLLELEEFNRSNIQEDKVIPDNLENFIEYVSKTGVYIFPWVKIQKLYLQKVKNVLNSKSPLNVNKNTNNYLHTTMDITYSIQIAKERILERMKSFTNAPFTIQRISELLIKPEYPYKYTDKFIRGLEKCVMVVTTIDPNGNKIFVDNYLNTNGNISSEFLSESLHEESVTPVRPLTPIFTAETPMTTTFIQKK